MADFMGPGDKYVAYQEQIDLIHETLTDAQYPGDKCNVHARMNALLADYKELTAKYKLAQRDVQAANDRADKAKAEIEKLDKLLDNRAGRLLRTGAGFFVVKTDEPYAPIVAGLIKQHEGGDWTDEDDHWAVNVANVTLCQIPADTEKATLLEELTQTKRTLEKQERIVADIAKRLDTMPLMVMIRLSEVLADKAKADKALKDVCGVLGAGDPTQLLDMAKKAAEIVDAGADERCENCPAVAEMGNEIRALEADLENLRSPELKRLVGDMQMLARLMNNVGREALPRLVDGLKKIGSGLPLSDKVLASRDIGGILAKAVTDERDVEED